MFPRLNRKHSAVPLPVATDEDRFAEILEALPDNLEVARLPEGRFGQALARLLHAARRTSFDRLELIAKLSKEASETAVNTIWMAHDLSEMTRSARAISSAVEELATSIDAIAGNSADSAALAARATGTMAQCATDSQAATDAMVTIERCTADIDARLDILDGAAAQIGAMASMIEAIAARTNMLALNATIEAARAGEAGRGFAVVAGEVKALSHQTSGVTEEIRKRLAAFAAEMADIRAAVGDSRSAVGQGRGIVSSVADQAAAAGKEMSEVAERARHLAEYLAHQRAATAEIAEGTEAIASKISKTETEIGAVDRRLAGCEDLVEKSWGDAAAGIARVRADAAIFKRKLAAILVGVDPPILAPAWLKRDRLEAALNSLGEPAPRDLVDRLDRAVAQAEQWGGEAIGAIGHKDWRAATHFYERCEAALDEVAATAALLSRAIKDKL